MAVLINLLPDIKQQRLKAQRRKRNLVIIALAIMAVGVVLPVIAGLTLGTQKLILDNLRENNQQGIEELKQSENLNEALTAQNQLDSVYNLRDNGEDISGFLDVIERAISPAATLSSINITSEGILELSGSTTDVDEVNVLVQSLSSFTPSGLNLDKFDENRQPFLTSVNVRSISPGVGEEETTFSIEAAFSFSLLDTVGEDINTTEGGGDPFNERQQN